MSTLHQGGKYITQPTGYKAFVLTSLTNDEKLRFLGFKFVF